MVELHQLKQLVAVNDCGTMSAAARALHISQPALSRSIQRLEETLSVQLFDHARNRTKLTETGLFAVDRARNILRAVEDLPTQLQEHERSIRTISVGSCAPAPIWYLTEELAHAFDGMSVRSEIVENDQLLEGLRNSTYQIIIVEEPLRYEDVICRLHASEKLFLSVPLDHPLAGRDSVRLEDLAGMTMLIHNDLGRWQRLIDKTRNVHFIVQKEISVLIEIANASTLPGFTTEMVRAIFGTPPNRIEIPVDDEDASAFFYMCVLKKNQALLDCLSSPGSDV